MKLFRFELKEDPGTARSGIVLNGRIYETDGAEATGQHLPQDVRPLSPVPKPGSLRFFPARPPLGMPGEIDEEPAFFYGNPAAIVGASTVVNVPERLRELSFEPYLAAVLVTGGYDVDEDEADGMVLGLSIMVVLVDRRAARIEGLYGRSHDVGIGLGPVITTPDELNDYLVSQEFGRAYRLEVAARVNGVERARGNVEELPFTVAQAIAAASRSCTLHDGDVIAVGPLCDLPDDLRLEGADEITVSVENLGALSLKLASVAEA